MNKTLIALIMAVLTPLCVSSQEMKTSHVSPMIRDLVLKNVTLQEAVDAISEKMRSESPSRKSDGKFRGIAIYSTRRLTEGELISLNLPEASVLEALQYVAAFALGRVVEEDGFFTVYIGGAPAFQPVSKTIRINDALRQSLLNSGVKEGGSNLREHLQSLGVDLRDGDVALLFNKEGFITLRLADPELRVVEAYIELLRRGKCNVSLKKQRSVPKDGNNGTKKAR